MMLSCEPTASGNEKFRSDMRQFGGLLFGLSLCATIYPMADVCSLISGSLGTTAFEGIPLASLIASLLVVIIGMSGTVAGYLQIVHDYSHILLTTWVLVIVQTAWLAYLVGMSGVGMDAAKGYPMFGLNMLDANNSDVWVYGVMGIFGVFSFGFCLLGSIGLLGFSLYSFQMGNPGDRASGYYLSRLGVYSGMVFVAGFAQLVLGAHTLRRFGNGPHFPPPNVAMFTITYPEISVTVGLVYMFNGLWGIYRSFNTAKDDYFQMSLACQWFLTCTLMILTQIAYLPEGFLAAQAPSRACLMIGAHVMPAFLDFKARNTPDELNATDYYGLIMKSSENKEGLATPDDENVPKTTSVAIQEQPIKENPNEEDVDEMA